MFFPVPICHNLLSAIYLAADSPPTVHHLTPSIQAVLRLPGKHFPSISLSVTAITIPSLLLFQCLYLANVRLFSCCGSSLLLCCPNRLPHPHISRMLIPPQVPQNVLEFH